MKDLSLYAIHRLVANALDAADVSNENRRFAIGHGLESSTLQEQATHHRRTGIVASGREKRTATAVRGVRSVTQDFHATSTAEQAVQIDQQTHIAALIVDVEKAKEDGLPVQEVRIRSLRLGFARRAAYRQELGRVGFAQQQSLSDAQLRALRDVALRELREDVLEEEEEVVLTREGQQSNQQGDDEHLVSPSEGQDGADGTEEPRHHHQLRREYHRASGVDAAWHDPAATSSSDSQWSGDDLKAVLRTLSANCVVSIKVPELDLDVLLPRDGPRAPLAKEIAALVPTADTSNGLKMAIEQAGGCPECVLSYADLPNLTLPQVDNHLQVCQRKAPPGQLAEASTAAMSGRLCCHRICAANGNKFEADVEAFLVHLKRHQLQLAGAVSCEFFLPNGHKCPFRLSSQATAAIAITQRVAYEMAALKSSTGC